MPEFKVTAPDGRILKITGETTPTDSELEAEFSKLPIKVNTDVSKAPTYEATPEQEKVVKGQNDWVQQYAPVGFEEATKAKGPIGWAESFNILNKWEMIPFLNAKTIGDDISVKVRMDRIKDNKGSPKDTRIVNQYLRDMAEIQLRGYTTAGTIVDAGARMPAYAVEFATTFGGSLGKTAVKTGVKKGIKASIKAGIKTGVKQAPKKLAKVAAKTGVMMQHRVIKGFNQSQLNEAIQFTDKGQAILGEAETSPYTAYARAYGDTLIENLSEMSGATVLKPIAGGIRKGVGKITPKVAKKMVDKLSETAGGKVVNAILKKKDKVGFDGLLEELGEERVGDIMRFAFDLDEEKGYSFEQLLDSTIPDKEQFLVEAGLVSIFGASSVATNKVVQTLSKRNIPNSEIEKILNLTSELEKDAMVSEVEKDKLKNIETEEDVQKYEEKLSNFEKSMEGREEAPKVMKIIDALATERAVKDGITRSQYLEASLEGIEVGGGISEEALKQQYRIDHQIDVNEIEGNTSIDNLTRDGLYPDDIYSNKATQYYGSQNKEMDKKAIDILQSVKGNPEAKVKVYRATPKNIDTINKGDWITLTREYADMHGESSLGGNYSVLEEYVLAKDIITDGNDIHEQAYKGASIKSEVKQKVDETLLEDYMDDARSMVEEDNYDDLQDGSMTEEQFEEEIINTAKSLAEDDGVLFQEKNGIVKTESPEFKNWFGESKVVDSKGEPLVVYHGSNENIQEFKEEKTAQGIFWFSSDKAGVEKGEYANRTDEIIPVYLNIKNPANEQQYDEMDTYELEREGFDGVKFDNGTYIAFSPTQIKSVDNKGTFDTNDANIYKQENGGIRGQFDPMNKIITIFEKADKSTIVHELAHSYLTYVQKIAPKEYERIAKWSSTQSKDKGISGGVQIQEHFARGFEAYLRTGKAPTPALKSTFEHFKEWLSDIYNSILDLNIKLDQDIVDYFDGMFNGKTEARSSEMEILLQSGMSKEEAIKAISDMETIKELKALTKNVNADNVKELQTKITKFIRELPISQENKAKFISSIKEVRGQVSFDRAVDKIFKRATQYYETELKNKYEEKIAKEIKMAKNISQAGRTVGKYDYTTNKTFTAIKEYDKMTQEEAFDLFEKSQGKFEDDLKNLGTNGIKLRFLALKSGGKKYSSSTLYRNVYEDLKGLREQGRDAKQLQQWFDKLNNVENIKETKTTIDKLKALKISTAFDRGLGDFETLMNTIGGKDFSEKFNFIDAQKKEYVEQLESQQEINGIIEKVYKAKPSQVPQIVLALNNDTNYSLEYQNKELGVKNMSRMNIVSVYNLIQNPKVRQDYFDAFGEIQVLELVNQLTAEERAFGDGLRRWLADAYTGINEVYVKLNNVDLPMVENYFPSRAEHTNYNDIFNDFKNQSTNPSFVKSRIAGQTVPDPTIDAYKAVISYSQQAAYIKNVGMRHRELQVMFKDLSVKNAIVSKYGQKTYDNVINKLDSYTLSGLKSKQDSLTSATNRIIGNWTMAKIGLNLGVYAKQMISQINFATGMPSGQFSKFYLQGMMMPAETKKFMMEGSAYLRARKEKGGSDIVADAIASSERLSGGVSQSIYETTGFNSVKMAEYITSLQRRGDIAGWVYGGYAKVQHLMKNEGLTKQEAFNRMENEGLKTQQSSLSSQMADIQNSAGLGRIFTKFKNTQLQYYRLMKNATTQAFRGEIDIASYSKIMTTYGLVNPALFGYMGYFFSTGLYELFQDDKDDETNEEKLTKDMFFAIATNPINAIPFFGQIYDSVLRSAVYDYSFDPSIPIVGDAYSAFTGYGGKFDPNAYEIISTIAETTAGVPVKTWGRYLKKSGITEKEKESSRSSSRKRSSDDKRKSRDR